MLNTLPVPKFALLLSAFLWGQNLGAQPCRQAIGYYPSWKFYERNKLVNPATIDYSKYTVINYAFFKPETDGSVTPFDPAADKLILLGETYEPAPSGYRSARSFGDKRLHLSGTSLVDRAHENGVKVLISIGGWTLSDHFSAIAADPRKRERFAQSCADMIRTYGVDGVDIDWEYPCYKATGGSSADRRNFTLLLETVRDAINAVGDESGKRPMLTAAFGVAPTRMADIEWDAVTPLLDYVNLMTYDFYGLDHGTTNHHAPLFAPAKGIEGFDTHSVVHHLMERYGVPSDKINIGVAFYGKSVKTKGSPGLFVASKGAPDAATFPEDGGSPEFYNIIARQSKFNYHWDTLAQAPYLKGRSTNTFVSFDDERSVAQKARYILDHRLAGAIIWDITGDYVETRPGSGKIARTPLADALVNAFCNVPYSDFAFAETTETADRPTLEALELRPCFIKRKTYAPRLAGGDAEFSKKKEKKKKKKNRRKRGEQPERYFDGGW